MATSTEALDQGRATTPHGFLKRIFTRFPGNCGWPILLRELRGTFRRRWTFVIHSLSLCLIALAILWGVIDHGEAAGASPVHRLTSVELGRALFDSFFLIQLSLILLVFPSLASMAFTEERTLGSYDLLICTDLRPAEIALGKLLAISSSCLITVIATIPLLTITTLFGGVSFVEIAAGYAVLVGLTLFIAQLGCLISSRVKSSMLSLVLVYCLVVPLTLLAVEWVLQQSLFQALGERLGSTPSEASGLGNTVVGRMLEAIGEGTAGLFLLVDGLGVFALAFLLNANSLRPRSDDRSSPLRGLAFGMALYLGFRSAHLLGESTFEELEESLFFLLWYVFCGLLLAVLVFSTENSWISRRLGRRFSRLAGLRFPLRLLTPGAFWGMLFSGVLVILASTGLHVAVAGLVERLPAGEWARTSTFLKFLPFYFCALASLGFCLSTWGFTPLYNFLTVFFIVVITTLLPVIFSVSGRPDGLLSLYYLSPVTIYQSLGPESTLPGEAPRYVVLGSVPVVRMAGWVFTVLTVSLAWLGILRARQVGLPLVRLGDWADRASRGELPESPGARRSG